MNKTNKRNILISSILAIMLCVSLIAGATFALFTSESKVNIAVTSGKVDVVATISNTALSHKEADSSEASGYKEVEGFWGGSATLDESAQTLTLDTMVPMDKISFQIDIVNNSNVAVKYRTVIMCDEDNGLFDGLTVTIGEDANAVTYEGRTSISNYATLEVGEGNATIPVVVEMTEEKGSEYQDKSCTLSYKVEAVQGNAATTDPEAGLFEIYTKSDLKYFQKHASEITGTVKLINDIDLGGADWTPIQWNVIDKTTFDGNGKTISHFNVESTIPYTGFFGVTSHQVIKDLTIDNATVKGINHVGAIVGHGVDTSIERCVVTNSKITTVVYNNDDGDKAGAIAGWLEEGAPSVTNCTVDKCVITGYRDIAGLVGHVGIDTPTVANNIVKNTQIIQDLTGGYKTETPTTVGEVVGRIGDGVGTLDLTTNITENNTISQIGN